MRLRERALYHQIHPAKLATDILASVVSLWLFWHHRLWLGLAVHFIPPVVASAALLRWAELENIAHSRLGRYVHRYMNRTVEAVRLAGDLVTAAGAWFHSPATIAAGLLIVAMAWLSGWFRA